MKLWAGVLICAVHQGTSFFSQDCTALGTGLVYSQQPGLQPAVWHAAGTKEQFLELSFQWLSLEVSLAARTFLISDEPCLSDELVILVLEVPNPCLV